MGHLLYITKGTINLADTAGVVRPRHCWLTLYLKIHITTPHMKNICMAALLCWATACSATTPIEQLTDRIDAGASRKFIFEKVESPHDFFELDQQGDRVVVRGNSNVTLAKGLHWYLRHYARIHLSWNAMHARLPDTLPPVTRPERHETDLDLRYDLNYCTFSYTMPFWDWARWEEELDWMAMHGINLPLALVGTDVVWRNVLLRLGYTTDEVNAFIAGPAWQAWWLMNNLEGWGGPNTDNWYRRQEELQRRIVGRMRELDIEPVLPGYSGMVPSNAKAKLGLDVTDPGTWNAYQRPAFLSPTDPRFADIAGLYYDELTRLYGRARYYAMDPFHEGGNTAGVDLRAAGRAIHAAMKRCNPNAAWVVQAWQANPRRELIAAVPRGDLVVLDLFAESRPQWGDTASTWCRPNGFDGHDWIYCMLLNYGGNVGLHGKMDHVLDEFRKARASRFGATLRGVGMTMEGSENNPVMFELLCDLPWLADSVTLDDWLAAYVTARYGRSVPAAHEAWRLLRHSVYECPAASTQQGTHESIFCARPSSHAYQVSSWSEMKDYYAPSDVVRAAGLLLSAADELRGSDNYTYDLVDVMRQAVAETGRAAYAEMRAAIEANDADRFDREAQRFLSLILVQDNLLATRSEFRVGTWLGRARRCGRTPEEQAHYEWSARTLITIWGNRAAADRGGLHDYAHREWNGLLRDFYYQRWKLWIDGVSQALRHGSPLPSIDWYSVEEPWTRGSSSYTSAPEGAPVDAARRAYHAITAPD